MRSTPKKIIGFQMLTKEARADLLRYEYTVLCLLVLIAICSTIWSVSIMIISGDFSNGLISAKLEFQKRDFAAMDNKSREILSSDLKAVISDVYEEENDFQMESTTLATAGVFQSKKRKNKNLPHIYMSYPPNSPVIERTGEQETQKSSRRKRSIIAEKQNNTTAAKSEATLPEESNQPQNTTTTTTTTTQKPKVKFDPEADRAFLGNNTVNVQHTLWSNNAKVQFFYNYPIISEIVAIIWAAMCFIFQTGTKKTWGLPKPWRIVVPSLVVFTLMFFVNLAYTIVTNGFLKRLCTDLRSHLTKPDIISCGQAFTLLRPVIRDHVISLDAYLQLIRGCYMLSMVLWLLALIIMIVRYVLALDFQLIDVDELFERTPAVAEVRVQMPYSEVPLNSPRHKPTPQAKRDRPKSEDDFQSAKSHISEAATPLLPQTMQHSSPTLSPVA